VGGWVRGWVEVDKKRIRVSVGSRLE
jgi:hypothetical protein